MKLLWNEWFIRTLPAHFGSLVFGTIVLNEDLSVDSQQKITDPKISIAIRLGTFCELSSTFSTQISRPRSWRGKVLLNHVILQVINLTLGFTSMCSCMRVSSQLLTVANATSQGTHTLFSV